MSHKVKERLSSRYGGDVMFFNEGYSISVLTSDSHFIQKATKIPMNLVTCSRSQTTIHSHISPHILSRDIPGKAGSLQ